MSALKRTIRVLVVTVAMLVGGGGAALARPLPVVPDPEVAPVAPGPVPSPELVTQGFTGWATAVIATAAAVLAVALTLLAVRIMAHRHQGSTQWSRA